MLAILPMLAVLLVMPFAVAQPAVVEADMGAGEVEIDELEGDPGITPDSFWYGLDRALERINLALTFNKVRKAEKGLEIAKERLLEAKKMAEEGNVKAMERAQVEHDKVIEGVKARIGELQEDKTENRTKESIREVVGLQRAIQVHEYRIEVLKDVLAKEELSDEAREAIREAIEKMENKTEVMKQKAEERKGKMKIRLMAIIEKTEEEVEEEIENIEDEEGLTDAKKKVAEKTIEKAEVVIEKLKTRIEEEKTFGLNVSVFEEQIGKIEGKVEKAKAKVEEGEYKEAIAIIKPVSNYGRSVSVIVRKIKEARQEGKEEKAKKELVERAKEKAKEKIKEREEVEEEIEEEEEEVEELECVTDADCEEDEVCVEGECEKVEEEETANITES